MSLRTVLNASVGSTEVLVASGIVEVRSKMVLGYGSKGFETVCLTSKGGECFVGASLPAVGVGARSESGVHVVLLLVVFADLGG